jgi:uncharacterized membrane protein YccC
MTLDYYLRNALRYAFVVFIACLVAVGSSFLLSGFTGGLGAFFSMPVIAAVLATVLDRKLPETRA